MTVRIGLTEYRKVYKEKLVNIIKNSENYLKTKKIGIKELHSDPHSSLT